MEIVNYLPSDRNHLTNTEILTIQAAWRHEHGSRHYQLPLRVQDEMRVLDELDRTIKKVTGDLARGWTPAPRRNR